jgi:hypothetical protein
MRLSVVDSGHALKHKINLKVVEIYMRARAPGVVKTVLYRPDFFGGRMLSMTQHVMRGPSEWAVGERELFAAFISRTNQCPF